MDVNGLIASPSECGWSVFGQSDVWSMAGAQVPCRIVLPGFDVNDYGMME